MPRPVGLFKNALYYMIGDVEFFAVSYKNVSESKRRIIDFVVGIIPDLFNAPIVNPCKMPYPPLQFFFLCFVQFEFELPDDHLGFSIAKTIKSRTT